MPSFVSLLAEVRSGGFNFPRPYIGRTLGEVTSFTREGFCLLGVSTRTLRGLSTHSLTGSWNKKEFVLERYKLYLLRDSMVTFVYYELWNTHKKNMKSH